jgi:hypothetical protein
VRQTQDKQLNPVKGGWRSRWVLLNRKPTENEVKFLWWQCTSWAWSNNRGGFWIMCGRCGIWVHEKCSAWDSCDACSCDMASRCHRCLKRVFRNNETPVSDEHCDLIYLCDLMVYVQFCDVCYIYQRHMETQSCRIHPERLRSVVTRFSPTPPPPPPALHSRMQLLFTASRYFLRPRWPSRSTRSYTTYFNRVIVGSRTWKFHSKVELWSC